MSDGRSTKSRDKVRAHGKRLHRRRFRSACRTFADGVRSRSASPIAVVADAALDREDEACVSATSNGRLSETRGGLDGCGRSGLCGQAAAAVIVQDDAL